MANFIVCRPPCQILLQDQIKYDVWDEYVAHMEAKRNLYKILAENLQR
jgi:hypothetical protein